MLGGLWLVYFCFGLISASLAPLVAPITAEFGLSHAAMGTILGAWQLCFIVAAAPGGALLDRYGIRRALVVSGCVIAGSALLRTLSTDYLTLLLTVAVFGLGGPLVSVGAPKMIGQWFGQAERGLAMGIYISGVSLGNVFSLALTNALMMPLFGGNWRSVLIAYAMFVLGVTVAWYAIASHPASRAMEARAAAEPRRSQREVFGGLIRSRAVQIVLAIAVCIFAVNHALNQWLPEILRAAGMSAASAGYWASIPTAVGIFGALAIPRFAIPARRFAMLIGLFLCAGTATLLIHSNNAGILGLALTILGIARSTMMPILMLMLLDLRGVSLRNAGAAGGLFFSTAEIGGVLGPAMLGVVSDATGGFTAPLILLTALCALMLALLWLLKREQRA
jgi:cyanate permease